MNKKSISQVMDLFLIMLVITLAFLSLSKSTGFPASANYVESLFGSDKSLHFFAGMVVTLAVFRWLFFILESKYLKTFVLTTILSSSILSADEFSQVFNVYRQFSFYDLYAGFLGLLLGLIILLLFCSFSVRSKD
ncbi:VanZ family protein [Psychromonas sp. KJ10-10]|uniref:VanZ family protein n=1 Tax=Psychromonas sp. KJ10-10 TaxID=3391823 RepID=UPI0039B5F6D8